MIRATQVMAWKTAAIFGEKGLIDRGLSHVGGAFKSLDTPHMSNAIDSFGHAANMAAGIGGIAGPILSSMLPSADAKIQMQMHKDNRADRQRREQAQAPAAAPAQAPAAV